MKYTLSTLEEFVVRMYRNLRIYDPEDITEENICFALQIHLRRKPLPSFSYQEGRFKIITLDSRLSLQEQREIFFHELGHLLRHAGSRNNMPKSFVDMQEWDADRFMLYAAIPIHMLHLFNLKDVNVVNDMARRFKVTPQLAQLRLDKIKEKMIANRTNAL